MISPLVDLDPVGSRDEEEQEQQASVGEEVLLPAARQISCEHWDYSDSDLRREL